MAQHDLEMKLGETVHLADGLTLRLLALDDETAILVLEGEPELREYVCACKARFVAEKSHVEQSLVVCPNCGLRYFLSEAV